MGTRSGAAAAVCLLTVGLAWGPTGCTGDDNGIDDSNDAISFGEVSGGGDTTVQPAIDIEISEPSPNAQVVAGDEVAVAGRATLSNGSTAGLSWRVETDETVAGHGARTGTLGANGEFATTLTGLGGGQRTITVIVDPDGVAPASQAVTVMVRTPAPAPVVAAKPPNPTSDQDINAEVTLPDGVEGPLAYRWTRDGAEIGTGPRLDKALTTRGDVITLSAWIMRDGLPGLPGTTEVAVGNAPPSCAQVSLVPSGLATGDKDLTCACVAFADADGDADASTCAFYDDAAGGALVDTAGSCVLPAAATTKGMEVRCVLRPHDGSDGAEPVTAATTTGITNTAPSAPAIALQPSSADATTDLTCAVTTHSTDPDAGDSVTYVIAWLVNGEVAAGVTSPNTSGVVLEAVRGDAVSCRMQASDGQDTSSPGTSAELVFDNATPRLINVFVEAEHTPPTAADTLTCQPQDGNDPDHDTLTYIYTWSLNGTPLPGATDETLSGGAFARGDKVSCTASACDPGGACSPAVNAKLTVTIGNAPPTVGGVGLLETPGFGSADGAAQPEDTLTCTYDSVTDPDGDAVDLVYGFYLALADGTITELQSGTDADFTVPEDLPAGAILHCTITPADDADAGAPGASAGFEVVAPTPIAPTVTLTAPGGAEGDVTCAVTDPGRWLPSGAETTFYWSVNGEGDVAGDATLAAADVLSCDRVTCRAVVGAGASAISSEAASLQLALGADCDDGNPCTGMACLAEGGCQATLVSGPSCDDGDPCTVDDVCQSGVCAAGPQTCVEDRLSVTGASVAAPTVTATPGHGYVAHWFGGGGGQSYLRASDGTGSRVGQEVKTAPAVNTNYANAPVVLADGKLGVLRLDSSPASIYVSCGGCWNQAGVTVHLGRYTPDGVLVDETPVWSLVWAAYAVYPNWGARSAGIGPAKVQLLGFGDGGLGIVRSYANGYTKPGIELRPIAPNLTLADPVTLVPAADLGDADKLDVEVPPDGLDRVLLAWAGADGQSVMVRRFGRDGTPEDPGAIVVAEVGATVTAVRVAGFRNGRFVVLWEASGLDGAGYGVSGQRFDDGGAKVGEAFQATAATLGDQRLGDVAALANYGFVVAYRDTSDVTAAIVAQRFGATAAPVGDAVVVNAASTVGPAGPAIAPLDDDEWVVAWNDAAGVLWSRRFTPDGELAPRVPERRVAAATSGDQRDGDAAIEAGGNTLVVWTSPVYIGMGTEIVARAFDGAGVAVGGEVTVNDFIEGAQTEPAVAGGPDRFVVAWTSEGEDGSVEGVYARRFDGAGAPLGGPFGVPETTSDSQRHPAVAMAAGGGFAVAWSGYTDTTDQADIYVRAFGADGAAATGELRVNGTNKAGAQERPALALVPFTDTYVVAWQTRHVSANGFDIYVRKIGADGANLSPELRVNAVTDGDQRAPALAVSQADVTAVCWTSAASGGSDVVCQLLKTSTLAAQGAPFTVHAELVGNQEVPRLAWLASGRLLVAYATESLDHDGFAVQTARFDNLGALVGTRRTVNRRWDGDQRAPWLVAYDEAVFVGYDSAGQDGDGVGVYFRALPVDP